MQKYLSLCRKSEKEHVAQSANMLENIIENLCVFMFLMILEVRGPFGSHLGIGP